MTHRTLNGPRWLARLQLQIITKAAQELHVTAAAVSHQVKALEDYLNVKLFRRVGNVLFLTDAGQACLPGLRDGFAGLERAMEALRHHDLRGPSSPRCSRRSG